jgi:hypothetical protein
MIQRLGICGCAAWFIFASATVEPSTAQERHKRLIEFGWDEPDTHFLRTQTNQLQQSPFDGCVFHVNHVAADQAADDALWTRGGSGNFTWQAWGERAFTEPELARAIADLQATAWGKFRHNFLRLNVTPGAIDWFDDYSPVVQNARLAGMVARAGNCAGILLDTEQYEGPLFNYSKQRHAGTKSWDEYAAQARRRGAEVMTAMQESFPNLTILLTFGYSLPWQESQSGQRPLAQCDNGLLAPFLDGMLSAATGTTQIVDGYEQSYGYRSREEFARAHETVSSDVLPIVADPPKYAQVFKGGFGIWMDYRWRELGWSTAEPAKNHFSPESLKASLEAAWERTDQYVWLYSETPRWWSPAGGSVDLPAAYDQAVRDAVAPRPPPYVAAKAYYVLPETHNNQSGYFSLCEGLDGMIYVGTAKYGENAYLVEFDPRRETQRIVIDTHQLCQLNAQGFAAQAKIHTRNDVGASGRIYCGSKQGYPLNEQDTAEYPGGYFMTYDPRTAIAENWGMPYAGQGIADVESDEVNQIAYIVTCEDQHWMLCDLQTRQYRELGPMLTPYAMTLVAADGCGYALTKDFQLARYDPKTGQIQIRPIQVGGATWTRPNDSAIPTWVLTADRKRAYAILMNDPTLLEIDLTGTSPVVSAVSHGKMKEGKNPDSRCALDLGADGNLYAAVRIDNETGFGSGYLHHLVRFLPTSGAMEDLGVIAVSNPDFFDWSAVGADGKPLPFTHGYHRLPDGTLTPLHVIMSLDVTADNTIYLTTIYPFTLLRVDAYRIPPPQRAAERYLAWADAFTATVEQSLDRFATVGEVIADRHIAGGLIGFPFESQPMAQDLWGRSGGMVHIGFSRPWKADRTPAEQAMDVGIVGYEGAPGEGDLKQLQELKARGVYLVGFGPQRHPALAGIVQICDQWFDSGFAEDDRAIDVGPNQRAGRANIVSNAIQGATLIAEVVGALTRRGKMPTIWKGYAYPDGREWGDRYFGKHQFHTDFSVPPLPRGELGGRFLRQIRYPIRRIARQGDALRAAAKLLAEEIAAKQKVYVSWQGHMPFVYIGRQPEESWAVAVELHPFLPQQVENYRATVPDGVLLLNLGYHGLDPIEAAVRREKQHRVIHMSGGHDDPAWRPDAASILTIDLGYAFGDSCVPLENYPIRLFAPSGIAQVLAYEAIKAELN